MNTPARSNNFPSQGNSSSPSSLRRNLSKPRPPVRAIYLKCDNVSVEGNSSLAPADLFQTNTLGARDLAKLSEAVRHVWRTSLRGRSAPGWSLCVFQPGETAQVQKDSYFWRASLTKTALKSFFCKLRDVSHVTSRNKCQLKRPRPNLILQDVGFLIVPPPEDTLRDPATAWQQLWRDLKTLPVIRKDTFVRKKTPNLKCVRARVFKCWCVSKDTQSDQRQQ